MTFAKPICFAALLMTAALVGCGGGEGEQMATDQELSDYAESQASPAFKQAIESMGDQQRSEAKEE